MDLKMLLKHMTKSKWRYIIKRHQSNKYTSVDNYQWERKSMTTVQQKKAHIYILKLSIHSSQP